MTESPTSWTDTLGRPIPAPVVAGDATTDYTGCTGALTTTGASLWSIPGPNGNSVHFKFCYAQFPLSYTPPSPPICSSEPCSALSGHLTQFQSIVLPNGTAWTFNFDDTGAISQITLPTGGTISYTWGYNSSCFPALPTHYWAQGSPAATARIVNDGTGAHPWGYALSGGAGGVQKWSSLTRSQ